MAIAINPNQTRDWVKPSERSLPPEQQTVFKIRSVPFAVRSHFAVLLGMAGDPGKMAAAEMARLYVLALRCCLVGWRNFRDSNGNEVPFVGVTIDVNGSMVKGAASDESLDLLDTETSAELGQACLLGMVLTKGDVLG